MIIRGKILDVIGRNLFEGEIVFEHGIIKDIVRKKVTEEKYILPGFIDSHVHVESSMLTPVEFGRAAVRRGTVAAVCDPHEIANVLGLEGVDYMIEESKDAGIKFYFGAPSCVPATEKESSGAKLGKKEIAALLKRNDIWFLSEVMNFPGVISGDKEVLAKINYARKEGKRIDGHAPGLNGSALELYCKQGITTDHECSTLDEAREKIRLGMSILIREGSAARNLEALHTLFNERPEKLMLCCDDIHPETLEKRHIDSIIKELVRKKYNLFDILAASSLNPVMHYGLNVGLLRIGDQADFIVVEDLENFNVQQTWVGGKLLFDSGRVLVESKKGRQVNRFNCSSVSPTDIVLNPAGERAKVIVIADGELVTGAEQVNVNDLDANGTSLPADILKLVVKERYKDLQPSVALIKGTGLKHGAMAGSVAHDSHNIIAVGTNDEDICRAINLVVEEKGGLSCCNGKQSMVLPLPVAGLMSDVPCGTIAVKYNEMTDFVIDMGSNLKAPFMTLSFMSLLVIPHLKLGDRGLFDVDKFSFTELFE